jgi:hypothetical protein
MKERFGKEDICLEFAHPVENNDSRILAAPQPHRRDWAIMFNHLDMIKGFYESDAKYGIFCEDDILIRRDFKKYLPEILATYERLGLEILLLGYLLDYKPVQILCSNLYSLLDVTFTYHSYHDETWGSQMYLLNRATAEKFLRKYTTDYAVASLTDSSVKSFSPDWTLTKYGRRAAIYPMMAVEEGIVSSTHQGQSDYHRNCYRAQFDPNAYH